MSAPARTRLSAVAAVLTGALVVAMAGSALGAEPVDCSGFDTREQARAILGDVGCESLRSHDRAAPQRSGEGAVPVTTPATAPEGDGKRTDSGCPDFATQAAAQAALAARPGDQERLDADNDGIACEQHFGTNGQQVAVYPQGGVATGGSS